MLTPSIKVLMFNTIPSTQTLYQHQCMRHCCPRFWSKETSLGFDPFMHRISQFLIPDKGEGMNKIHKEGKGAGGGQEAPNRLGLGRAEASPARGTKSHKSCSPRTCQAHPPTPAPAARTGSPEETSSLNNPSSRHSCCCLQSFMNIVARPFLSSLLLSREPQTFCTFISTSLFLLII